MDVSPLISAITAVSYQFFQIAQLVPFRAGYRLGLGRRRLSFLPLLAVGIAYQRRAQLRREPPLLILVSLSCQTLSQLPAAVALSAPI
jgi:hypothetical protein